MRSGFHRPEPALHEARHLEQEQVDERAGGQEHAQQHRDALDDRLLPVGQLAEDHLSMSPRMKWRDARIVMTSGTYTPRRTHGVIETLLKLALRIFTRNGPRSPLLTT